MSNLHSQLGSEALNEQATAKGGLWAFWCMYYPVYDINAEAQRFYNASALKN